MFPEQLWCCGSPFEMNEATNRRLPIHGAASIRYIDQLKKDFEHYAEYLGSGGSDQEAAFQLLGEQLQVDTRAAQCGNPADEAMIRVKIEALGGTEGGGALVGYKLLDAKIFKMRMELVRAFMADQVVPTPTPIAVTSLSADTTSMASEEYVRGMMQKFEEATTARMAYGETRGGECRFKAKAQSARK